MGEQKHARPGRPRREATDAERSDIERLSKRFGILAIAARLGLPERMVRREMEALQDRRRAAREWTDIEDDYLHEHAGSMLPGQIVGQLRLKGYQRTERAVKDRLVVLSSLGRRELRPDLSVQQVALLIGRSDKTVTAEIERGRLRARKSDGWRTWPSELRDYINADMNRVDWSRCEKREVLALLLRQWGVSDDERKRKAKARREAA